MTDQERKKCEKSFRVSIHFMWWVFIIYGNWKRNIVRTSFGFHILDFSPFKPNESKYYDAQ